MKTYNMNRQNVQGKYFKGGKTGIWRGKEKLWRTYILYFQRVKDIFLSIIIRVIQLCFWSIFIRCEDVSFSG